LPGGLAELLVSRAARCGGAARTVLSTLAVAGRPLGEDLIGAVSGLDPDEVRGGLRELTATRLLADATASGEQRPRHALLAEAVAAELLPSEKTAVHERLAQALQATSDDMYAAEVAGHWAAASRATEELPARVRAAEAAERVFGYADAATHWQRAIELYEQVPDAEHLAGIDLPHLYLRGFDALDVAGERTRRRQLGDEAYRRFANHPDPATAAAVHLRHAWSDWNRSAAILRPAFEQALHSFEGLPPSIEQAKAWFTYGEYMFHHEGRADVRRAALTRALDVAEAAGATGIAAGTEARLAHDALLRGQVVQGLALIERARALAEASRDGEALVEVALDESDILLKLGRFDQAAGAGLRAVRIARESGRHTSFDFAICNAAEALLAQGRTQAAAQLIDPLTDEPVDPDHYSLHAERAEVDLRRGHLQAADTRLQQIKLVTGAISNIDVARELAQLTAEIAVWAGRPADGLAEVEDALSRYHSTDWTIQCGWLLAVGMRACADLAEQGRARGDQSATETALSTVGDLDAWVDRMGGNPFVDHPYVATIPAERATWEAERSRLAGTGDPAAWQAAADAWAAIGCPHRAAYAEWRQAETLLSRSGARADAANSLRQALEHGNQHAPLTKAIRDLARLAHITPDTDTAPTEPRQTAHRLTDREMAVLQLIADGKSNREIGAALYMSPKTASVHVSAILRKLGAGSRVEAAVMADRIGLSRQLPTE
jgi:DNA-binding CsgD family transcriptional regulator